MFSASGETDGSLSVRMVPTMPEMEKRQQRVDELRQMGDAHPDTVRVGDKRWGASIIPVSLSGEVLLFLRDNKQEIPYPNCWDLLGGTVEPNETPRQCIVRELLEEVEVELAPDSLKLFNAYDMADRLECTFWKQVDFDIRTLKLNEGQQLQWFSESEIEAMPSNMIAFSFRDVILEFFRCRPWRMPASC